MNFRERVLNTFRRQPVDNIVFQPRLDYLFNRNKELGTLSAPYRDLDLLGFYDELGCSPRPYGYYTECLEIVDPPEVKRETWIAEGTGPLEPLGRHLGSLFDVRTQFTWDIFPRGGGRLVERVRTPLGDLEKQIVSTDSSYHTVQYPVETADDVRVLKYILQGRTASFNLARFGEVDQLIGDRSAPMMMMPRTNVQRLNIELMGFEKTIFALHDQPTMMEELIRLIDETDERLLDAIAGCPVPIVSFDDNIDQNLVSPKLFRRYILPTYRRRIERLRAAGKTCHSHWDGMCKQLLPLARETGLDGVEAVTPEPMGSVTIPEIKAALGEDMILLDGIPMTAFLPFESDEALEATTRRIVETFAPNLILGISDEPSPDCSIDKIRRVCALVGEYEGRIAELARSRARQTPETPPTSP